MTIETIRSLSEVAPEERVAGSAIHYAGYIAIIDGYRRGRVIIDGENIVVPGRRPEYASRQLRMVARFGLRELGLNPDTFDQKDQVVSSLLQSYVVDYVAPRGRTLAVENQWVTETNAEHIALPFTDDSLCSSLLRFAHDKTYARSCEQQVEHFLSQTASI